MNTNVTDYQPTNVVPNRKRRRELERKRRKEARKQQAITHTIPINLLTDESIPYFILKSIRKKWQLSQNHKKG